MGRSSNELHPRRLAVLRCTPRPRPGGLEGQRGKRTLLVAQANTHERTTDDDNDTAFPNPVLREPPTARSGGAVPAFLVAREEAKPNSCIATIRRVSAAYDFVPRR